MTATQTITATTAVRQAAARARFAGDPDAQRIAVQAAIAQIRVGVAGPFQRRIVAQARRDGRI
jgi:hypothetical protein